MEDADALARGNLEAGYPDRESIGMTQISISCSQTSLEYSTAISLYDSSKKPSNTEWDKSIQTGDDDEIEIELTALPEPARQPRGMPPPFFDILPEYRRTAYF
jgi:hypothetical protein